MSSPIELLKIQHRDLTPAAERFCLELKNQIAQMLNADRLSLGFPIEWRVKQWDSISTKLDRLGLNIATINELNDFAGLRLILLFRRDVPKVCNLLANNFTILARYDTQDRLKEDQFGYSSIHYVIELPEPWLTVPTLSEMRGLRAEVQVRTVAQHVWAAASHVLQYKQEEAVPPPLRRSIYRVSALLETVDLEFERVLNQRAEYRNDIEDADPDLRLNVDILEKTLDSLLPVKNKGNDEDYADLLTDILHFGISTRQELEHLVRKHLKTQLQEDSRRAWSELKTLDSEALTSEYKEFARERWTNGVFFYHTGLVRNILTSEFGTAVKDYLTKKLENLTRDSQRKTSLDHAATAPGSDATS